MGKCLVTCSVVILVILLLTDIDASSSRSGSRRSSSSSHRGSNHKPSQSAHRPSRPVHQPSRPVHKPSKPAYKPARPVETPIKPEKAPVKPVQNERVQSPNQPIKPVQNPAPPQHNPANPPPYNPAYQPHNPANPPPYNPAYQPHNPANPPPYNPAYQPHNPANPPPYNPANQPHNPANPQPHNPAYPPQNPGYPQHNPAYPPQNPANAPQNPVYPPHNPANAPQNPVYPPHNPANAPQNPVYPPHNPANAPQNPVYPPHNPAGAPQNPGYPQHNPAYPPQNPGYPQHNPAYPPHNPANAPQNPAYPPQNPGYPQHNPGYPQNPGYPPRQPGYPQNPNYPHNPGYNPGYPHNPSGGQYVKPWKPKPPKTKMHMVGAAAGGAVAGALGGFLLGRAMSNMNFNFNNRDEERWWYENRNRYADRVYFPQYEQPVPEDVFVKDCWNITVKEFLAPTGNDTADEMEARVVTRVVQEMCVEQYRSFSRQAGGANVGHHSHSNAQEANPSKPVLKFVEGEALPSGAAGESDGYLFGSAVSTMQFRFNDSAEAQWWEEHRARFASRAFRPNYSQPVSKEVFVSDCVNATTGEEAEPSGNQTAGEAERAARVAAQVVPEICAELYCDYARRAGVGGAAAAGCGSRPLEPTVPAKLAMKYMVGAEAGAIAGTPAKASGGNANNDAGASLHLFLLGNPSVLLLAVLSTWLLLP